MMTQYASQEDMATWARGKMQRHPDCVIGEVDAPYMRRWWIVPRNEQQNVYLHQIVRDDDDRALHDHPWDNVSYVLIVRYREITPGGVFIREAGSMVSRRAVDAHRLELVGDEPCVSLFFTGPKVREWGFHCPQGFVHWKDFTAGENGELVGRGCGEMDELGLKFDYLGGNCPVQAEGTVDGQRFYFRARGEHWALHIGPDDTWFTGREWVHEEPYGDKFEAGWMDERVARACIDKAVSRWRAERVAA